MSSDLLEAFGAPQASSRTETSSTSFIVEPSATSQSHPSVSQVNNSSVWNTTKIEPVFRPGNTDGNDILFDADDDGQVDNDDDFGDFESVTDRQQTSSTAATAATATTKDALNVASSRGEGQLIDLLSLDDTAAPTVTPQSSQHRHSPLMHDFMTSTEDNSDLSQLQQESTLIQDRAGSGDEGWGAFEDAEASPPQKKSINSSTNWQERTTESEAAELEHWDDFEDGASETTLKGTQQLDGSITSTQSSVGATLIPANAQRPTNVPPPAILLSLLPTSITDLVSQILSTPAEQTSHSSYLLTHHRVACRLVSNPARTLRWRRDTILAQSTRISLASKSTASGGAGAMKLSSVNKGESAREEREAAEAVEVWNRNLHHFSKALIGSGTKLQSGIKLRLSMTIPVKPVNGGGAIQSTIICPLCGLKRNERVVGADDVGAEDVFGEYWLENWGHRDCAEWWYRWKGDLSQR